MMRPLFNYGSYFMLKPLALSLLIFTTNTAWAAENNNLKPLFDNTFANMTYPQVAGNYLVYNQRIQSNHQIMRLNRDALYGDNKSISADFTNEVVRNGIAFANGDIAYVSNRLGRLSPWLSHEKREIVLGAGTTSP